MNKTIIAGGIYGFVVGITCFALAVAIGRPDPVCVPSSAVQYDGQLDAWLNSDHVVVLMAHDEDQFPWCTTIGDQP